MRKNTRKSKNKLSTKLLALLLIATTIVAINVGIFRNKTREATISVAKEGATQMPFTENQILDAALRVAMNGYTYTEDSSLYIQGRNYYNLDCSTYVSTVIEYLGGRFKTDQPNRYEYSSQEWENNAAPFKIDGQTYIAEKVAEAHNVPVGTGWTNATATTGGSISSYLKPGDIIVGNGHMFLYVGKAASLDDILTQLSSVYGDNIPTITYDSSVHSEQDCYNKLNVDPLIQNDEYWYIEGNIGSTRTPTANGPCWGPGGKGTEPDVNIPCLRNYNWPVSGNNDSKQFKDVWVYRLTSEPETYTGGVGVFKYDTETNQGLADAKFKLATAQTGGEYVQKDEGGDYVITTDPQGYACFEGIDLGTDTERTYYLEEIDVKAPYIRITNRIPVTVKSNFVSTNLNEYHRVGNNKTKKGKGGVFKFEDENGDGKRQPTEKALSGATFALAATETDANAGRYITGQTATTNQDGFAIFSNVDLGTDPDRQFWVRETHAPDGYDLIEQSFPITITDETQKIDYTNLDNVVVIPNKKKIYDLALRKYITAVKDGATGETTEIKTRKPKITVPENFNTDECTTLKYEHTKDPVTVHTTDIVTYNIEVYNEGPSDAYSQWTKDDIPEGLEFVPYTKGDGSVNDKHRWIMVDENDEEVTDPSKAKYIITDYLSKDQAEANDRDNLIKAFDPETMKLPDSKVIQVQFKVTEPTTSNRILENKAQIMTETDANGNVIKEDIKDRDSNPNEWLGEDDEDYEQVRVLYFDLALRKWVVQAIVTQDGKETIYETGHKAEDNPEDVVKVDLKKSKLKDVTVKFKYKIRVKNEGEIAGEAKVVRDDVPKGLKFVQADNPNWKEENGKIVTEQLADVTLEPGESVEMDIILTWINGEENMGVMDNISEIEKDHNEYGTHDIDSTPGNNKWGEDDIDDAPVMLTVKTGSEIIKYVALGVGLIAFIGISGIIIKRKVLNY